MRNYRHSWTWLTTGAIAVFACSSNAGADTNDWRAIKIEHCTLSVPPDMKVEKKTPVHDFDIYSFYRDTNLCLRAYVGNCPRFPIGAPDSVREISETLNRFAARTFRWTNSCGRVSRETLVNVKDAATKWPRYVHFWYHSMQFADGQNADEVIGSIHSK